MTIQECNDIFGTASCETAERPNQAINVDVPSGFSRRNLFRGLSAGFAAVGLVSLSDAAFAASAVTVCKTTDIKVGSARIFNLASGKSVVITQPKKGVFKAFSAYCTHEKIKLDGLSGTNLICSKHNAYFDTTSGARTNRSPARSDLPKYVVTVSGTSVKVTI